MYDADVISSLKLELERIVDDAREDAIGINLDSSEDGSGGASTARFLQSLGDGQRFDDVVSLLESKRAEKKARDVASCIKVQVQRGDREGER